MKKWSILPVIAAIVIMMPAVSSGVAAQSITADKSVLVIQELSLLSNNLQCTQYHPHEAG